MHRRKTIHSAPLHFSSDDDECDGGDASADIPASLHALDCAYNNLKKRYNELSQKNMDLMKQMKHTTMPPTIVEVPVSIENGASHLEAVSKVDSSQQTDKDRILLDMDQCRRQNRELELHNENLLKEVKMLTGMMNRLKGENSMLLEEVKQLKGRIKQQEEEKLEILQCDSVAVESEVMMGLEQLLQIVHKQQKEMAELRGQAEQQKLLIAEIHKLHLDNGGDPLISLPTQCTEMDINGTEQMRQDGHIPLPSPRLGMVTPDAYTDKGSILPDNPLVDLDGLNPSDPSTSTASSSRQSLITRPKETNATRRKELESCLPRLDSFSFEKVNLQEEMAPPSLEESVGRAAPNNHARVASEHAEPRPLNFDRNVSDLSSDRHSNISANINLNASPARGRQPVPLNNDPFQATKPTSSLNLFQSTCVSDKDQHWAIPREDTDGDETLTTQVCPVCNTDFSPPLSEDSFQGHVHECLASGGAETNHRICPVCNRVFADDMPLIDFQMHVETHFNADFSILGSEI